MTDRLPRPFDRVLYYGDLLPVIQVRVDSIVIHDEAGGHVHIPFAQLEWDGDRGAWFRVPVSYLRCATCGHKLDDFGGCDSCAFDAVQRDIADAGLRGEVA